MVNFADPRGGRFWGPPGAGGGGGGGASTYTHYRLYVDAVPSGGSGIGVEDLALRASVGGVNQVQVLGGTASASSAYSGFPASAAFNGDLNDKWFTLGTADEWLQWEFPVGVTVAEVLMQVDDIVGRRPMDFRLQASNDGTEWTDVLTVTGKEDWVTGTPVAFATTLGAHAMPTPASFAYYRLHITGNQIDGQSMRLQEFELRTSVGGASVATGGTALASSELSSTYSAAKAFDGNTGTRWISASDGIPNAFDFPSHWLQYQLTAAETVVEYALIGDDAGDNSPSEWVLLGSDDGIVWTLLDEVVGEIGWGSGEERTYTLGE